jgi:hypothetical protein
LQQAEGVAAADYDQLGGVDDPACRFGVARAV